MTALCEEYRPKTFDEVIGQDKIINRIRRLAQRGLSGRGFWISGASGTGKTTIARLIAAEVASQWCIEELDAQALTPARLRQLEENMALHGLGEKTGRAYIVNEAHGLSKAAIRKLLTIFDGLPGHVVWIFTTTSEGQQSLFEDCDDGGPLLSRCVRLELSKRGLAEAFAARANGKRWGGSRPGRRLKVTPQQVEVIHGMKAAGEPVATIARTVGLSRPTVYDVLASAKSRF